MRSYVNVMLMLVGLLVTAACSAPSGKAEMKTHTSLVPGSKLTVVHFSAPW